MSVDLVRIVDSIHREKNIPKDVLFEGIESALATAAKKHFPDADEITVSIDQESGKISTLTDGTPVTPPDFGRIAAQTAKQVIIQKIREAERDSFYDEFDTQRGELITGTVKRFERGAVTVDLGKERDAFLPRSEQIPGESNNPSERVRAVILDVRKVGQRVKIILSRTHPDFVRRLFELEIPEIADQTISIRALAREAGYRSKVAVTSIDAKVDAVGACVGVRGTRIKNIVDELGGERIDIVRWNESLQVLIPNALQPAEIDEVMLCQLLGRAIVLVREDQLSLAIGRRGQNVRLASKLVGWDIEIMTSEELDELIEKAVVGFTRIEGIDTGLAEKLVEQGILSYDDLSVMEIVDLVNTIEDLTEEVAVAIVSQAEALAEEQADDMPRRKGARPMAPATPPDAPATDQPTSLAELFTDSPGDDDQTPVDSEPTSEAGDSSAFDPEDDDQTPTDSELVAVEFDPDEPSPEAADPMGEDELELVDQPITDFAGPVSHSNGHEITSAPSDADQDESASIMIDAVEANESATILDFHEMGDGPNSPEPFRDAGSTGSAAEPPASEAELNSPDDPDDFFKGSREP